MTYEELLSLALFLDRAFWRSKDLYIKTDDKAALAHCLKLHAAGKIVSVYMFGKGGRSEGFNCL